MCEPVTILTIGAMAYSARQQAKMADRQAEAAEASAQAQQDEKDAKAQQELSARQAEARRNRGRMIVAQAESGLTLGSQTFEETLAASFGAEARDIRTIKTNAKTSARATSTRLSETIAGIPSKSSIYADAAVRSAGVYGDAVKSGLIIPK